MRPRSEKESLTFYFSVQKLCPCQWFTEVKLLTWREGLPTTQFQHSSQAHRSSTHHLRLLLRSSSSHAYFSSALCRETSYHLLCLLIYWSLSFWNVLPHNSCAKPILLEDPDQTPPHLQILLAHTSLWPDFQGSQTALIYLCCLILYIIIPLFICLFLLDDEHLWSNTVILNFKMLQNHYLFPPVAPLMLAAGMHVLCPVRCRQQMLYQHVTQDFIIIILYLTFSLGLRTEGLCPTHLLYCHSPAKA